MAALFLWADWHFITAKYFEIFVGVALVIFDFIAVVTAVVIIITVVTAVAVIFVGSFHSTGSIVVFQCLLKVLTHLS